MTGFAIVVVALCAMEGVSYLTHRFVMHGFGIGLHRSHHDTGEGGFELNDLYPLMFSSVAIGAFAAGTFASVRSLVLVGIGITLYGVSYLFVHEIYIHRRLHLVKGTYGPLEWMKASHRIHHLYGGEPFGMLLPLVPKDLRRKAENATWDPFDERAGRRAAGVKATPAA